MNQYIFVYILFFYRWLRQEAQVKQKQLRGRVEIVWNSEHFFSNVLVTFYKSSYFAQTTLEFRKFEESLV